MRTEKIVVTYKVDDTPLTELNKEFERLKLYVNWSIGDSRYIFLGNGFSDPDRFIRTGGLAKALKGVAVFSNGYYSHKGNLSLKLNFDKEWSDVLEIMRSIDTIEV